MENIADQAAQALATEQENAGQQQVTAVPKVQKDECNFCEHPFAQGELRMCCHECKDFSLCLDCFKAGAEYKSHRRCHEMYERCEYEIVAWPDGFTVQDDLLLLEAIELHGVGSWDAIRAFMKRPENEPIEVVVKHWAFVYSKAGIMYQKKFQGFLPDIKLYETFETLRDFESRLTNLETLSAVQIFQRYYTCQRLPSTDVFISLQSSSQLFEIWNNDFIARLCEAPIQLVIDMRAQQLPHFMVLNEIPSNTGEGTGQQFVLGSWPYREEFTYELCNKAEYPIMYLHFSTKKDTEQSLTAKIRVLECYVNRLIERHKRKRFLYQYSLHREDRRVDDVSVAAETAVLTRLGRQSEIPNLQFVSQDEAVCHYEAENPELLRGFATRMDFRKFAASIINERTLREAIFRLEIARILGFRQITRMTEVVNFLKNPDLPTTERHRFPVGTVHFDAFEQQRYTVDSTVFTQEFKIEIPPNIGAVKIDTSMCAKQNVLQLEVAVDTALRERAEAEEVELLGLMELNLKDKILTLMRTNFRMPANELQSYSHDSCARALSELRLASFAELRNIRVDEMIALVKSLQFCGFNYECQCGGCFASNYCCGKRCFAAYFERLVNAYRIAERQCWQKNYIFKELGGVLNCGCVGRHYYNCLFLNLDVYALNVQEHKSECERKQHEESIASENYCPSGESPTAEGILCVSNQMQAVDAVILHAENAGYETNLSTFRAEVASPVATEVDTTGDATPQSKGLSIPDTDDLDIFGKNLSQQEAQVSVRYLLFKSPEFSMETLPHEQLESYMKKKADESSESDEVHQTIKIPNFSNDIVPNTQQPFLTYFFEDSVIPHYATLRNIEEVIETLHDTNTVPFFNPTNEMLYLNRAMDLILHMTEYMRNQAVYTAVYERSSSFAVPLIAQLIAAFHFLCAMISLSTTLFGEFSQSGKATAEFNTTYLTEEQILLILLQTFEGLTYLPKCKDFSVIAHFITDYPKIMLTTFGLDENLFSTEQLVTTALNSQNQPLIEAAMKLFSDEELLNDMQRLLEQDHCDSSLLVEAFCRRISAGGAALKQALLSKAVENALSTAESTSNQTPASPHVTEREQVFHAVFAASAIQLVLQQVYTPASNHIMRTVLMQAVYAFGLNSTTLLSTLFNEISKRKCFIEQNSELTDVVVCGIAEQFMNMARLTCESVQYSKPLTPLLLGGLTINSRVCYLARMLTFEQCAAMNYLLYLPDNSPVFVKRQSSTTKQQARYSTESLGQILTTEDTVLRMTRDEYMQQRIRLFENSRSIILHVLSETKLRNVLSVLQSIVGAVELELNTISQRESSVLRIMNDAFPSDQINANAAAIDRNLGEFLFVLPEEETRGLQALPIKKTQQLIVNILRQENIEYEDYMCVEPIDFLFGPKVQHNGGDDPHSIIPMNENIRKLKQTKTPENREQKATDFQEQAEYVERYLTRGELALCCIARLEVANYLQAKMSFVSNGYIVTNHVLAALDWRPGIAETMAFLCLAEYNEADSSTLPRLCDTDNCFSAFDWSFCTPDRVFSYNPVLSEKEYEAPGTGRNFKVREIQTNIEFKYHGNTILHYTKLSIINSQIEPQVQALFPVPAGLLFKSTETQSIEAADKLSEKLNQIILKTRIFQDFSESARGAQTPALRVKRSPEQTTQTDRSYYRDHKDEYTADLQEIAKHRRTLRSQAAAPPTSRVFVQKVNLNAPQIWQFHSYGTHDEVLQRCFDGYSMLPEFPVSEFERLCPFLMQHLKDNMRRK